MRNPQIIELFKKRPSAVGLLLLIVNRAKNTEGGDPSIKIGESFIGDFKEYGATLQIYRTDKQFLKDWQISTFKSTNKGTIAKLKNRTYFDTTWFKSTSEATNKLTDEQQTTNKQPTTNIEIRNKKYKEMEQIWTHYITAAKTKETLTQKRKEKIVLRLKHSSLETILSAITKCYADPFWRKQNIDYIIRSNETLERMANLKTQKTSGADVPIEEWKDSPNYIGEK
ncbi:MAG: hypothetical protein ABIJ85_01110 [bacterium]